MNYEDYTCMHVDHESKPIIGFCLHQHCSSPTQYCCYCYLQMHDTHLNDLLAFDQMSNIITRSLTTMKDSKNSLDLAYQKFSKYEQNGFAKCEDGDEKLIELENSLNRNQIFINQIQQFDSNSEKYQYFYQNCQIWFGEELNKLMELESHFNQKNYTFIKANVGYFRTWDMILNRNIRDDQLSHKLEFVKTLAELLKNYHQLESSILVNINDFNEEDQSFVSLVVLGQLLWELQHFEDAISYYDKAIRINKQDYLVYCLKGYALQDLGKHREAIECFDKAIALNSTISEAFFLKGLSLLELKDFLESTKYFDEVINRDSKCSKAFFCKALILNQLEMPDEAMKFINKAIDIKPGFYQAYLQKGLTLKALSQHQIDKKFFFKQALKSFDLAAKICPQNAWPIIAKAATLSNHGYQKDAFECYDQAMQLDSKMCSVFYNKGILKQFIIGTDLLKSDQIKESIELFNIAININPQCYQAYCNKGSALFVLKCYQEALECFNRAIEINSTNHAVFLNQGKDNKIFLADALIKLNKFREAEVSINKGLLLNPNTSKGNFLKGKILNILENYKAAIGYLEKSIAINPFRYEALIALCKKISHCQAYHQFFQLCLDLEIRKTNDYGKVIKYSDQAIKLNPQSPDAFEFKGDEIYIILGYALFYSGVLDESLKYLKEALKKNSKNEHLKQTVELFQSRQFQTGIYQLQLFIQDEVLLQVKLHKEAMELKEKNTNNQQQQDINMTDVEFVSKGNQFQCTILIGLSLFKQNQYKEAIKYFDKAILINPKNYSGFINKGKCFKQCVGRALHLLNQNEEAIKNFDQAILINQQLEEAYLRKGDLLFLNYKAPEALSCYDQVIIMNGQNDTAYFKLGIQIYYDIRWRTIMAQQL